MVRAGIEGLQMACLIVVVEMSDVASDSDYMSLL